jgi:hypothetical protein
VFAVMADVELARGAARTAEARTAADVGLHELNKYPRFVATKRRSREQPMTFRSFRT